MTADQSASSDPPKNNQESETKPGAYQASGPDFRQLISFTQFIHPA